MPVRKPNKRKSDHKPQAILAHNLRYLIIPAIAVGVTISAVPSTAVHAQEALEQIVITANRTPSDINKVGSSVEVIDREELEKHKQTYLKDYLERLPGVTFSQNGPPGSTGSFQIRGALGQYVKILIDGMDVSDLAAPQAVASFEHILVADLERIEVLKGPQSTLYGSEAVGGVISITTRRANRGTEVRANFEAGSYNTKRFGATVSYGTERGDISFTAQGISSDGFSSADENAGNSERDGYENLTFSGRAQYRINETLRVFFSARKTDSEIELDAFSFATSTPIDDTAERSTFELRAMRGGFDVSLFDGRFVNTFAIQRTEIDRENFGGFPITFNSERTKYEYKGVARFSDMVSFVIGADRDETTATTANAFGGLPKANADINGYFAQALVEPVKNLNFSFGVRRDDHSNFGTFDTYRITGAYYIPTTGTKFRASYGTAFRAPSLFELFDPGFGNPDLNPEESKGWDVGIDQSFAQGRYKVSATYFALDIENLVEFNFPAGYTNVPGTTERHGVELSGTAQLAPWLTASASYTYTDTEDATGARLIRVPRHVATFGLDIKPMDRVTINATAHHVRDTLDLSATSTRDFELDNYWLVNAKASYDVSERLTLYVRGVNLLDDEYQTIRGYGTSDRAVYAGLTMKLAAPQPLEEPLK